MNWIHKSVLGAIMFTQEILKPREFYVLNVVAYGIHTHIDLCINWESSLDIPYNDISLFSIYDSDISLIVDIIVIIFNLFISNYEINVRTYLKL